MFDTMTLTKIVGGFCGALLIFLLGGWAAETIYHVGGHGEDEQAYMIEVPDSDAGAEASEGDQPPFEEVMASADPAAGERVFGRCRACHQINGTNAVGPYLDGVVGRDVDAVEGFAYSGALEEHADVWSADNLNLFLEDPRGFAPGTIMAFNGLPSVEDRANLIAYLDTLDE